MSRYGISALLGLFTGIAFIVGSVIVSGHADYFWNLPSAFITVGGTFASVILDFPPKRLKTFWPVIKSAFVKDTYDPRKDIMTIVALAQLSKREGLLALERAVDEYTDDPFLKKGVLQTV